MSEVTQKTTQPTKGNRNDAPREKDGRQNREKREENGERSQNDRRPRRDNDDRPRRPRKERDEAPRERVTLETEVPALPDKKDRVLKPDEAEYKKKMQEYDDKIDELYKGLKKFIEDTRRPPKVVQQATDEKSKDLDKQAIQQNFQEKLQANKVNNQQFKEVKEQFNKVKSAIEENFNKQEKLKGKLKGNMNKDQMEAQLKNLKEQHAHGTNTLAQEKVIIAEISSLEKTIPFAAPLDALQKELVVLREQKKVLGNQMNKKWEVLQSLNDEISLEKEQLDMIHNKKVQSQEDRAAQKSEIQNAIDDKKAENSAKVEELRNKKREFREKYYNQVDSYETQQKLVDRVNFILKIKTQLQKDLQRKEEYEAKRKAREEEEKQINELPYKEECDLLNLLIDYCNNLNPNFQQNTTQQQTVEAKQVDMEATLKSAEWKKDNCTVITKKELNDDYFVAPKKGKKNKNNNNHNHETKVQNNLNHQMDVLSFFDQIKVAPPMQTSELEGTVTLLKEKKNYYENLPKDAKRVESKQDKPAHESTKQNKKSNNKFDLKESEENFPGLV